MKIIWIDGTFGIGKSAVAAAIVEEIPQAHLLEFDALQEKYKPTSVSDYFGKRYPEAKKYLVDALVDEVLADLEPLAQEKNVKLVGKCKDTTLIGSDILIYRMVYNLVENAIKYNHSGGQVTVTAYQKENHVYLSVEDTGSGIPKELRERVFEPFFRVDKSRSRELGGVGLGLALVHEIVIVHDGSITVKSNSFGGTTFEVVL